MNHQSNSAIAMLYNRALTHMENRELGPTQKTCLKILSLNKDHAGSHMLLGVVASEFGKLKNAVEFLDRAADLDDRSAETWAQLARVRSLQRRFEDAEAAAKRARELNSDSAYIWDTLGVVYSRINNHALAAEMFRRAIDIKPDVASYWFNYGSSLQFNGEIEHAEEAYNTAIGLNDRFYKAHSALAQLRKQTKERNHVTRLTGLLDHVGDNADGELHLRHALAKECEDMARYDEAFAHLLAGKQRKTATLDYNIKHDAAIFAEIARTFPPDQPITPATSSPVDEPIFVIGMPRTGTTLVERILSSHPSVNSAGELQTFGLQLKRETGTPSRLMLDPETVSAAKNCNIAAVGKRYLREGYRIAGLASRFVDKMPLNFHYAGFIHQALPNAKFVCLQRNPMDTILSNFRQLFAVNFSYYNYAFDIKDTASYYLMFRDIIDRWQELLPDHMLQVSYEDLVENQEQVTRRILEHCNLPWEDACLTFEQNPSPVATASAVQVRQPMYRKAISRWKHYEKQLEPAQIKLEAAGIKIQ